MKITLREADVNDLPDILQLYAQLGQDDGAILPLDQARSIFSKIKDYPDYSLHLALLDNRAVGVFALLIMDNFGHMGAPSAVLEDVVVASDMRGQGVGARMMEYANGLCRQKGCYKMTFSSNLNRIDAHRFYESLGFKKHGYSFYVEYE
jgi:GNAT superfamily N-acetyltransferase